VLGLAWRRWRGCTPAAAFRPPHDQLPGELGRRSCYKNDLAEREEYQNIRKAAREEAVGKFNDAGYD
jgi:hypothetical protein